MTTLKQRAEQARQSFEESRARLFRADGSQVYSDTEHAERLANLRSERNSVLHEIGREAEVELTAAQEDLAALENGDPTTLLSSEELQRANLRRAHVLDDVASLTQEELVTRLSAVAHGGDRDSMFVYLQAGRRRMRELENVSPALQAALEELGEKLISDSRRAELEAARKRIEGAGEVRDLVWLAVRDQTTAYAPNYAIPGPGRK